MVIAKYAMDPSGSQYQRPFANDNGLVSRRN